MIPVFLKMTLTEFNREAIKKFISLPSDYNDENTINEDVSDE